MFPLCGPEFSEQPEFSGGVSEKNLRAFHLQITVLIRYSSNASLHPCDTIIIFKFIFSTSQLLASFLLLASLPLMVTQLLLMSMLLLASMVLLLSLMLLGPIRFLFCWSSLLLASMLLPLSVLLLAPMLLQVFLLCWPYCYGRPYALALVHGVNMGFLQREWAIFFYMYE
jgi:hypothetical protein